MSLAVKSVSKADDDAQRRILTGPVISVSLSNSLVWKVKMSCRKLSGSSSTQPMKSGRSRWSKAPGRMMLSAAEIPPPIVGTGSIGSNVYSVEGRSIVCGLSVVSAP